MGATAIVPLDEGVVVRVAKAALDEDAAGHDATNEYVGIGEAPVRGNIVLSAPATVCGIDVARAVFRQADGRIVFEAPLADAAPAEAGAVVCSVRGPASSILSAERTALNFLQRMCGVATQASRYVEAVRGTGVAILDTRKTTPLWRDLEKYAVRCGGARNHRRDLGSMVLVKDNHVRALGGREALLRRIAAQPRAPFVEVEVDSMEFLRELLVSPAAGRIDRVMLDNFTPEQVGDAMRSIEAYRARGERLEVEVSGGITLESIRSFAQPGVDFISVGAMTHSAVAIPMSLELL
ncbi:MAG TPA: carboxylating nicotinate-nucleotide diphosphorylase [Candidatus Krumholzibacteria bacterium]|nr:carboxylating nicotinate-nucleotide diphosphorylase [Candidatus Krumholzibacteria bacterium]